MKLKWIGHSSFLLISDGNVKVITDPMIGAHNLSYPGIIESVDIVTVSHEHGDHNRITGLPGKPEILRAGADKRIGDVTIKSVESWHDELQGSERGSNSIFCFNMDGISVCHLGDLGQQLNASQLSEIGRVDVLLVPIGGVYTIDIDGANNVCKEVSPSIIVPMHYKTDRCTWLKWTADDFCTGNANCRKLDADEIALSSDNLPLRSEIIVLKYAGQR